MRHDLSKSEHLHLFRYVTASIACNMWGVEIGIDSCASCVYVRLVKITKSIVHHLNVNQYCQSLLNCLRWDSILTTSSSKFERLGSHCRLQSELVWGELDQVLIIMIDQVERQVGFFCLYDKLINKLRKNLIAEKLFEVNVSSWVIILTSLSFYITKLHLFCYVERPFFFSLTFRCIVFSVARVV